MGARHRSRDADRDGARRVAARSPQPRASWREGLDCPVLVIHGDRDRITPLRDGRALARLARREAGAGRAAPATSRTPASRCRSTSRCATSARTPSGASARRETRPSTGPTAARARCTSPRRSGSATRSATWRSRASCAASHPDLQIDWLAQDPVTRVLEAEGERIHPASAHLANESRHIESESAEHDLHCFQALRRMDEILAANFMLFHDVVRDQRYDLWIGDEAWELDYYLHENPREKRAPFVWLTDFVGFLPMDDGDERERFLTADYNADMVDHVADHPEVRDLALFVGNPEDIVPERLGPGAADDPRLDRAQLRLHRLRDRLRPGRPRRARASCAPSSDTATTSACASSPSAARASARTCCARDRRLPAGQGARRRRCA